MRRIFSIICVFFLGLTTISATRFLSPNLFDVWETDSIVTIHILGGKCNSADIQLVNNGGFLPKDMGYVAKDIKLDGEQVLKFKVWDELPPDNTYQLAFIPKLDCGPATTAFSHMLTIVKNDHKDYRFKESRQPEIRDKDELYYFTDQKDL